MITIKELINKIKWDKKENPDEFTLYYYDRVLDTLIELNYRDIIRIEDSFMIVMRNGEETNIPLHRVRYVKKNNEVIWARPSK